MAKLPSSLERLIRELSRLPGIGQKSAQRLAFYLLKKDDIDLVSLSSAIGQVKNGIIFCSVCYNMAESDPCNICADPKRDHSIVCVVEESLDVLAIDKSGQFNGVYHVLGGVLNPLEGIGPERLTMDSLMKRLRGSDNQLISGSAGTPVREVIVATNPSLEGETTAMHIAKQIKIVNQSLGGSVDEAVKVTRIARGLPMGGDLEYADDITLMRAMEGRREY